MNIVWTTQAQTSYYETLDYWDERNGSFSYSDKITKALIDLEKEISIDPYALSYYNKDLNIYRRTILKGKFLVYYKVDKEKNIIEIRHFRSSKQKPLF